MKKTTLLLLSIFTITTTGAFCRVLYTQEDSLKITQLLELGRRQPKDTNMTLFYARQFLGVPYVAKTLEVTYSDSDGEPEECLVINARELDCTTFVETVSALVLTTAAGKATFGDYCRCLQKLRYRKGKIADYTSRNHYFTSWIDNAINGNMATLIEPKNSGFTKSRRQQIDFMSNHPELYPALQKRNGESYLKKICQAEQEICRNVSYVPTSMLNKASSVLSFIHDGDILALETNKLGLDVSHLGFAIWEEDSKLHLIHASSLKKKVIIDSQPLYNYQLKQKSQIGVRVVRLKASASIF